MSDLEIKNAIITSAELTTEDHGLLSSWIRLDYGGSCQGFGGYALYLPKAFKSHNKVGMCGHWIFRCMEIAGVYNWKDMVGKSVRVKTEHSKIHGIGHIIKDDWFFPAKDFEDKEKELNK